jgi:hypothetical protein
MIKGFFEDRFYLEMANFRPKSTGLPMVVWIAPESGREKHFARIKVAKHYGDDLKSNDFFTITVPKKERRGNPGDIRQEDIDKVGKWIDMNAEAIFDFWNKEIDSIEFGARMKPYVE